MWEGREKERRGDYKKGQGQEEGKVTGGDGGWGESERRWQGVGGK